MNSPAVAERPLAPPRPPPPHQESEPLPTREPRSQDRLRVSEADYWRDY